MEENFRKQIAEDISLIQEQYEYYDPKLKHDHYAFNYWVLSRIYNIDEEIIPNLITDGKDSGIDCFAHFEDTKEIFIIQNKYYSESTPLQRNEVTNFLTTPIQKLTKNKYKRSDELQAIFNRAKNDSDYKVWLHYYVSNNNRNADVDELFSHKMFNETDLSAYVGCEIYHLDDIRSLYFDDRFQDKKHFEFDLTTINKGTSLDVRSKEYGLDWMIDLRYTMVNVKTLYDMLTKANTIKYDLFDENIRDYLGTRGVNNGIIKTLKDKSERENFFYYNNGVTLICEKCTTLSANQIGSQVNAQRDLYGAKLVNPKIVNGCQTVNSIYEVLSHYSNEQLEKEFAKTYVLIRIYQFDEETKNTKGDLDKRIVKFTNTQTGVSEKDFAAKKDYFLNLQKEFERRGFLLLVKPSDKNRYTTEFKNKSALAKNNRKNEKTLSFFGLSGTKLSDIMIPLDKLIQVLLAYKRNGHEAFTKKQLVLKKGSSIYKDFSLNIDEYFTVDEMINIYLLYKKAEDEKRKSDDKKKPIPYYLIGFLGKPPSEVEDKDAYQDTLIDKIFSDKELFKSVYNLFKNISVQYYEEYTSKKLVDYNTMIKQKIDDTLLDKLIRFGLSYSNDETKELFSSFESSL